MSKKLYVLLRSDLESMTPGKAAAQVAHAASQCARIAHHSNNSEYLAWEMEAFDSELSSTAGFGTTIVLDGGSFPDGHITVPRFFSTNLSSLLYGTVRDPEYPIRDGKKTHLIPLCTCYWIFLETDDWPEYAEWLSQFRLYDGNHD